MPTIKEIAGLASTSISSVSRVINNSGYVREEVRVRIQKVLDETGYRPNALAKALHSKRSQTIGVILPKINATSSSENVAGIDQYFNDKGYSIILGNTNHSVDKELKYLDLFAEKQVDGIILIATSLTAEHEKKLKNSGKPFVVMGQRTNNSIPCVLFDEIKAAEEITSHLAEWNHKSIALISVPESDIAVGVDRKQGYFNALEKYGLSKDMSLVEVGNFTVESGYEACKRLLKKGKQTPDAIFAVNDKMAIGAINYLIEHGYKVPDDISVCGVGGGTASAHYNPKITSLVYDFSESGRTCAERLHHLIEGKNTTQTDAVSFIPYHLAVRESTKKR
ncbi:LacI family transcriptional regulator [Vibrio sp. MACH09]|uniref:LacI family DNA-binding transcriptional regulator n=1 Tax=Vibrio sp. MACH09 TaxID=3025122 RepID=UPI002792F7B6|nr:LacI family DNA-binding transcriptional regulator [Vibrio sp. MACH09]GLO62423.1 LacI family transcriptional regulator [Vibrio sp. MACH09]